MFYFGLDLMFLITFNVLLYLYLSGLVVVHCMLYYYSFKLLCLYKVPTQISLNTNIDKSCSSKLEQLFQFNTAFMNDNS